MSYPTITRAAIACALLAATTLSVSAAEGCIGPKGGDTRKFVVDNPYCEQRVTTYAKNYQAWMVATQVDNGKSMPRCDVSATATGNQRIAADVDSRDNPGPKGGSTVHRM